MNQDLVCRREQSSCMFRILLRIFNCQAWRRRRSGRDSKLQRRLGIVIIMRKLHNVEMGRSMKGHDKSNQ